MAKFPVPFIDEHTQQIIEDLEQQVADLEAKLKKANEYRREFATLKNKIIKLGLE